MFFDSSPHHPTLAPARNTKKLNEQQVQLVIGAQELIYEEGARRFDLSGPTKLIYDVGTYSASWDLSGDRYSPKFREADGWQCYPVQKDAERIRFKGEGGTNLTGKLAE
ncbi:hypothetical protein [Phaeobacter italicus]|uniref:hypothetical protein n=1 Tax=Phaeobacter italicus TaxID=481446 RepID=UPI00248D538A|nr:hypothetical protein [Phaeobacter italicus]